MDDYSNLFFFTYKKLGRDPVLMSHYAPMFLVMKRSGNLIDYSYEEDSKGILHLHALCRLKNKTPLLKRFQFPGFHSCIQPVGPTEEDQERVLEYIQKCVEQRQEHKRYKDVAAEIHRKFNAVYMF